MKKIINKLCIVTLVAVFLLGSASAFADDVSMSVAQDKIAAPAATSKKVEADSVKAGIAKADGKTLAAQIDAKAMTYTSTSKPDYTGWTIPSLGSVAAVISVNATATGMMYIDAQYISGGYAYFYPVDSSYNYDSSAYAYVSSSSASATSYYGMYVHKGDTVYIGCKNNGQVQAKLRAYIIPTGTRTLPVGKTLRASSTLRSLSGGIYKTTNIPYTYYKIKPSKTGIISVSVGSIGSSNKSGYITLCNSSKKAISEKTWYYPSSGYKAVYGVKKGTTYYIKVWDMYGYSSGLYSYGVSYTNGACKDLNILKKSKAKTLKYKKKVASTIIASTSKKADWYKFKVRKSGTAVVKFSSSNITSGKLGVKAYVGSRKIGSATVSKYTTQSTFKVYNVKKGQTVYLKITQGKYNSGKYVIVYAK